MASIFTVEHTSVEGRSVLEAKPENKIGGEAIEPLLVTMEDLQRIIGSGKTKAFAIVGQGEIETVQIGRKRMAVMESVKAYVARLREQAKSPIAA